MTDRTLRIANRIREARITAELSQSELANKLGITQTRLSNWEVGTGRPLADNIFALADVLNVSSDYLLGLSEDPEPVAHKVAAYGGGYNDLPEDAKKRINEYIELQRMKSKMDEIK